MLYWMCFKVFHRLWAPAVLCCVGLQHFIYFLAGNDASTRNVQKYFSEEFQIIKNVCLPFLDYLSALEFFHLLKFFPS